MAINAYTGLMGSGKSYEVVSSVIIPAIQSGRRVVTNIDGIDPDAIYQYILSRTKLTIDQLGKVVSVTNEDVCAPGFFPNEVDQHGDSKVKSGDLLAIDECWKFWSTDNKISDEHMTFFRMHRHYTHLETGVSCDVALMIQDLGTLHRKLKNVVEMTTRTVKLKALGLNSNYRIELYEGNKTTRATHIDTYNKGYKANIFPLYKSYAAGSGQEKSIDKRQNIFSSSALWIRIVVLVFGGVYAIWYLYGFFHPQLKTASVITPNSPSSSKSSPSGVTLPPGVSPSASLPNQSAVSGDWRVTGSYTANGQHWIVLVNTVGRLRLESPSVFTNSGYAIVGKVDGQPATVWSGLSQGGFMSPPNNQK